jgi:hypothetical protein
MKSLQKSSRKLVVGAAAVFLGGSVLCTYGLRADDNDVNQMDKMAKDHMEVMTPNVTKAATDQLDKMKSIAADPQQSDMMKNEMAKMIVMERLAHRLAMDPDFQKSSTDTMNDANVKKVHEDAEVAAKDPDAMRKLQDEIVADPMTLKMVVAHACMIEKMQDKMGGMNEKMMDDKK